MMEVVMRNGRSVLCRVFPLPSAEQRPCPSSPRSATLPCGQILPARARSSSASSPIIVFRTPYCCCHSTAHRVSLQPCSTWIRVCPSSCCASPLAPSASISVSYPPYTPLDRQGLFLAHTSPGGLPVTFDVLAASRGSRSSDPAHS